MNLVSALLGLNDAANAASTQATQAAQAASHAVVLVAFLLAAFVLLVAGGVLAAR